MKFETYRRQLFKEPRIETAAIGFAQRLSGGFFELFRNVMIVGVIRYLSEKTPSAWVFGLYLASFVALVAYFFIRVNTWYINLFGFLRNKRLANCLDWALNIGISIAFATVLWWSLDLMVGELSRAQGSSCSAASNPVKDRSAQRMASLWPARHRPHKSED
jgi:hypothetical protein